MSTRPRAPLRVPAQTAAVARAAFPKGALAMRVRDELGEVFVDGAFVDAFGARGRPGISPGQWALVTVLRFAENVTDRQAADAVRGRIDWKYRLGLALTDPGLDFGVLSRFRTRLVAHDLRTTAFDMLLDRLVEQGLVATGQDGLAIDVLRRVWIQRYTFGASGREVIWRDAQRHGFPPGGTRIVSPYDTTPATVPDAACSGPATRSTSARPATTPPTTGAAPIR